ncbi:MAG: hypothetical protein HUU46_21865 [Candidatus Hydrogenedentes bacterium]|nr:hypothetical protein [Candidatus Hydrogenedentota bacterium]
MISPRTNGSDGFTLWEMLVFATISVIMLNLCVVTFIQTTRVASLATDRAMRQQAFAQFSRDFSRTVRHASRVLPAAGETSTGGAQVVLDTPDGPVVVGMAGGKPAIWELVLDNGVWRVGRATAYPIDATVRFKFDSMPVESARRVTMHVTGAPRKAPEDKTNLRVLVAAFRVDGGAP